MPAINTFAGYAAVAILINFILQITLFVALLSLDTKRRNVILIFILNDRND